MTYPADVVLIAGPPCSGKTSLARSLAGSSDLIVDFDDIARRLGSPVEWLHPDPYRAEAEAEVRAILGELPGDEPGTAYVIRSTAAARLRAVTAKTLRARMCVLMATSEDECRRRAEADGRPDGTAEQIAQWFNSYTPWSGDTLVE